MGAVMETHALAAESHIGQGLLVVVAAIAVTSSAEVVHLFALHFFF